MHCNKDDDTGKGILYMYRINDGYCEIKNQYSTKRDSGDGETSQPWSIISKILVMLTFLAALCAVLSLIYYLNSRNRDKKIMATF